MTARLSSCHGLQGNGCWCRTFLIESIAFAHRPRLVVVVTFSRWPSCSMITVATSHCRDTITLLLLSLRNHQHVSWLLLLPLPSRHLFKKAGHLFALRSPRYSWYWLDRRRSESIKKVFTKIWAASHCGTLRKDVTSILSSPDFRLLQNTTPHVLSSDGTIAVLALLIPLIPRLVWESFYWISWHLKFQCTLRKTSHPSVSVRSFLIIELFCARHELEYVLIFIFWLMPHHVF